MNKPSPQEPGTVRQPAAIPGVENELWRLWRQGERPDVQQFLASAGALSSAQVAAVLAVDQRERWQNAERVPAEAYLQAYPEVQADIEKALELVYGEYLLREELGEAPSPEEYVQRFPHYADRLSQQFELHRALVSRSEAPVSCAAWRSGQIILGPVHGRGTPALAKKPADRYCSAAELVKEMQRYLADEPVRAYPDPLPARLWRWTRRHRTLVTDLAVLLIIAVAALGVGIALIGH